MSMEATSGKNPINHVGKIYNLLSNKMAKNITDEVDGIKQVHIMLSKPNWKTLLTSLKLASAQVIVEEGYSMESVNKDVEGIMDSWLERRGKI